MLFNLYICTQIFRRAHLTGEDGLVGFRHGHQHVHVQLAEADLPDVWCIYLFILLFIYIFPWYLKWKAFICGIKVYLCQWKAKARLISQISEEKKKWKAFIWGKRFVISLISGGKKNYHNFYFFFHNFFFNWASFPMKSLIWGNAALFHWHLGETKLISLISGGNADLPQWKAFIWGKRFNYYELCNHTYTADIYDSKITLRS